MPDPLVNERYTKGTETIRYIVYKSQVALGVDQVLVHKLLNYGDSGHITWHPKDGDPAGTVNFHERQVPKGGDYLKDAVQSMMAEYTPAPSDAVRRFILHVRPRIPAKR